MTSSACSTFTAPASPPLFELPETARMPSATLDASLKHAAVADRKRGMLIVRARASKEEMYSDIFHTKWIDDMRAGINGCLCIKCRGICAPKE